MNDTEFTVSSLYGPSTLSDLGVKDVPGLAAAIGMDAQTIRRRRDGSLLPLTRATARSMACLMVKTVLADDVLEHIDLTSNGKPSYPSDWLWEPATYVIHVPPDDPDTPVSREYVLSAMLDAARSAIAAYRFLAFETPSAADAYADEANALRLVKNLADNTAKGQGVPNMGLGEFDLDASLAGLTIQRIQGGLVGHLTELPDPDLQSCLLRLDSAAAILERDVAKPSILPVTKPGDPPSAGAVTHEHLPAVTARFAAYASPRASQVINLPGGHVRLDDDGSAYTITTGYPDDAAQVTGREILEAVVVPFRAAMSRLAAKALSGTVPETPLPELAEWLGNLKDHPNTDPDVIKKGIETFAFVFALSAAIEDPWAVQIGIPGLIQSSLTHDGERPIDDWVTASISSIMDPVPGPDPTAYYDTYAKRSIQVMLPQPAAPQDQFFKAPSLLLAPGSPMLRNGDLYALAAHITAYALDHSALAGIQFKATMHKDSELAGAALAKSDHKPLLILSVGKQPKDDDDIKASSLEKADLSDVLNVVLSAGQAVRCMTYLSISNNWIPSSKASARELDLVMEPNQDVRGLKLSLDALSWSVKNAKSYFSAHPEFRELYGFDFDSAIAAWTNLYQATTDLMSEKAVDSGPILELLDSLMAMV